MKYVIHESEDDTQSGLMPLEEWLGQPFLQLDVNGNQMKVVKEFEADTWEEAMQVYNDHYGFGKYIPMEE